MSAAAHTSLRLADVAMAVGGTVVGDGDALVSGIASLDRATPTDLTFLASSKYSKLLIESAAGGAGGGGSRLTEDGRRLIATYERFRRAVEHDVEHEFLRAFKREQ